MLAPSNAAMERAIEASGMTRRQLFNDPDFQELVKLHVIYGEYSVEKLRAEHGRDLPTLKLYNEVTVGSKAPGLPTINTVQLVEGRVDIEADNGVVHVIDELLAQAPTATLLVESTAGRERAAASAIAAALPPLLPLLRFVTLLLLLLPPASMRLRRGPLAPAGCCCGGGCGSLRVTSC